MKTNNSQLPLLASLLLAATLDAGATQTHYHLSQPGMCNKTQKTVAVRYTPHGGAFDARAETLMEKNKDLPPGGCLTLSFTVDSPVQPQVPSGAIPDKPHTDNSAIVTFHADQAWVKLKFDGGKHGIHDVDIHRSESICLNVSKGAEHFQVEIRRC